MDINDLLTLPAESKIAVVGLGQENRQFLVWLQEVAKFDFSQLVIADRNLETIHRVMDEHPEIEELNCFGGEDYLDCLALESIQFVFKAPGIWSLDKAFEVFRSRKGNDKITSSLVFFMQHFREQIVGITGTKGKSTTSSLVTHLLNNLKSIQTDNVKIDFKTKAIYCGNTTNISPYQYWTKLDQAVDPETFYVIELSSFQLQDLGYSQISPKYSVITNYYIDHQDQHGNPLEYWLSKDNIFRFQNEGDLVVANEQVLERSDYLKISSSKLVLDQNQTEQLHQLIDHALPGQHNQINVSLALNLVAGILSASRSFSEVRHFVQLNAEMISTSLASFVSLPHRIQLVHTLREQVALKVKEEALDLILEINFYDDGYATEPDANVAAIKTLTQNQNEFVWLQMTGKDKGSDLAEVIQSIANVDLENKLYKLDLSGAVGKRVAEEYELATKRKAFYWPYSFREKIDNFFNTKYEMTREFVDWLNLISTHSRIISDLITQNKTIVLNILFSPGGSSFDEFDNAAHRADWWVEKVKGIV